MSSETPWHWDGDIVLVGAYGKDGSSISNPVGLLFVKPDTASAGPTARRRCGSGRPTGASTTISVAPVVLDDATIVVGASGGTGSAYVFTEPSNGWVDSSIVTETAKLTASDGADADQFGRSVAVDGSTILVGGHQNDDNGSDSGSIYVFTEPAGGWADSEHAVKLTASDGREGDRFGIALALDGATALVAAPRKDANDDDDDTGNDVADVGSAYVLGISEWTDVFGSDRVTMSHMVSGLTNYNTYTFGVRAVNSSGDGPASTASVMPIPVPDAPINLSDAPGDGRVALTWDNPNDDSITKYQYSTDYTINGNGSNGGATFSDISGSDKNTTAFTVTGLDNGTTHTLAVRAVNASGDGAASTATAVMVPAEPAGLSGIALDSEVMLGWDDPNNSTITEYQLLQNVPRKLTAGTTGRNDDFFGTAVAVDGNTALVGALQAYDADFNLRPGAVYLFTRDSEGAWSQRAKLTASDAMNGDGFGRSVALDGDTAVVGAYEDDEGESGEGQVTNTGSVYVFTKSAGAGPQILKRPS